MSSSAPPLVVTQEHQRFVEFCEACRDFRYIGLCYGAPGVGKTLSARYYAQWTRVDECGPVHRLSGADLAAVQECETVFYTPQVVHSPAQIERDLQQLRGRLREFRWEVLRREETACRDRLRERERERQRRLLLDHDWFGGPLPPEPGETDYAQIASDYARRRAEHPDPTRLIVMDEADRLKVAALEQVRDHYDRSQVGLVLIGMPGLEKRLTRYPQLYSRVGFVHEYRQLSSEAVRELLQEGWRPPEASLPAAGWEDEEVLAAICRITGGNFRLLHRLLAQMARLATINESPAVTRPLVEAARESLVIGTV